MSSNIELSREKRAGMISLIQNFFSKERDEDLGNLAAGLILDFILEHLAPEFYNEGVADAYKYMGTCLEDMLGIQKQLKRKSRY